MRFYNNKRKNVYYINLKVVEYKNRLRSIEDFKYFQICRKMKYICSI